VAKAVPEPMGPLAGLKKGLGGVPGLRRRGAAVAPAGGEGEGRDLEGGTAKRQAAADEAVRRRAGAGGFG
jgi:hypothetical protein